MAKVNIDIDKEQLETLVDRVADEAAKRVLLIFQKGQQALELQRVMEAKEARSDNVIPVMTLNYKALLNLGYMPEEIGKVAENLEKVITKELDDMPPNVR